MLRLTIQSKDKCITNLLNMENKIEKMIAKTDE